MARGGESSGSATGRRTFIISPPSARTNAAALSKTYQLGIGHDAQTGEPVYRCDNAQRFFPEKFPAMTSRRALAATISLFVAFLSPAFAQTAEQSQHNHHHSFENAEKWSQVFDDPARDAWQKPDEIVRALALAPNAEVADIGAGTGYLSVRLARAVPKGRVYAADLEPDMVHHLGMRAMHEGLTNLIPVQAKPDDANLPGAVDLAIMVDVYHHIENREQYFAKLRGSLKPNGRLAIVDFRLDSPVGPPVSGRIAPAQVKAELARAGYVPAGEHGFLPYQYFLVFKAAK